MRHRREIFEIWTSQITIFYWKMTGFQVLHTDFLGPLRAPDARFCDFSRIPTRIIPLLRGDRIYIKKYISMSVWAEKYISIDIFDIYNIYQYLTMDCMAFLVS